MDVPQHISIRPLGPMDLIGFRLRQKWCDPLPRVKGTARSSVTISSSRRGLPKCPGNRVGQTVHFSQGKRYSVENPFEVDFINKGRFINLLLEANRIHNSYSTNDPPWLWP